jgi:hypothetical protein
MRRGDAPSVLIPGRCARGLVFGTHASDLCMSRKFSADSQTYRKLWLELFPSSSDFGALWIILT